MGDLLIGIDLGSGGCKATAIDTDGRLAGEAAAEYPTRYPRPGWSEQDPADWFPAMVAALNKLRGAGVDLSRAAAAAFDGSTHNAVLLDGAMKPVRATIMWTDQRSGAECLELEREYGDLIFKTAYQAPTPTWTLPQLRWLSKHEPDALRRTRHILFVKDYVRFLVTGTAATDHIEAQGTLFYDMAARAWSEPLVRLAGIDPAVLPRLCEPTDIVGAVTPEAARATGLPAGLPVACGASDSAVEDYGAGAVDPGDAIVKLATAGNVNVMADRPVPHPKTLTYSHIVPGMWYSVTGTNAAAVCLRWFRDALGGGAAGKDSAAVYGEMERLARESPPGARGVMFHPYLRGERCPHWDPDLRGSFAGIGMETAKADFLRAVLEGVAYSLRDCRALLDEIGLPLKRVLLIGGGARNRLWAEIVAHVMNVPVELPQPGDASFGSALLAGVGLGVFPDARTAAARRLAPARRLEPDPKLASLYDREFARYRQIHAALAPVYRDWAATRNNPDNSEGKRP